MLSLSKHYAASSLRQAQTDRRSERLDLANGFNTNVFDHPPTDKKGANKRGLISTSSLRQAQTDKWDEKLGLCCGFNTTVFDCPPTNKKEPKRGAISTNSLR